MKKGQMIGIAVAGICGLGAFFLMSKFIRKPKETRVEVQTNVTEVLVARAEIGLGQSAKDGSFRWQTWPQDAVPPGAITKRSGGNPMQDLKGGIARLPIMSGEPITRNKLVRAGEGGVLASILPQGMRAISAKITEETSVGRLILPNDHVDVILSRRMRSGKGQEEHVSETLFRNVRVLAIGQRIEIKEGQKNADGNTATLELTPRQAELLALAKSMGELSLALRSIADFKEGIGPTEEGDIRNKNRGNAVRLLKYGVKSRVHGIN